VAVICQRDKPAVSCAITLISSFYCESACISCAEPSNSAASLWLPSSRYAYSTHVANPKAKLQRDHCVLTMPLNLLFKHAPKQAYVCKRRRFHYDIVFLQSKCPQGNVKVFITPRFFPLDAIHPASEALTVLCDWASVVYRSNTERVDIRKLNNANHGLRQAYLSALPAYPQRRARAGQVTGFQGNPSAV
jgi:hypothetical protein